MPLVIYETDYSTSLLSAKHPTILLCMIKLVKISLDGESSNQALSHIWLYLCLNEYNIHP